MPCEKYALRTDTSECIYENHTKQAKEELTTKEHLKNQIIQALCTEDQVPEILSRLRSDETYEAIVSWLGHSQLEEDGGFSLSKSQSQHCILDSPDHDTDDANALAFQWSSITSDTVILEHLFQLYFAWVHLVHTLFSEGHFVNFYKHQSRLYFSTILVNAICAMACHLHSTPDGSRIMES